MGIVTDVRRAGSAFLRPVPRETRENLARLWEELPPKLRTREQLVGRHFETCGATVGVQPRCDFSCVGCYLPKLANRTPGISMEELEAQLALLRERVGLWGNVQLTDGEVTLRSPEELEAMLDRFRAHELIPMLMTHGDRLLNEPRLLDRLARAGLREISFHIDSTQRGRLNPAYSSATREEELNALRVDFADLVRGVRARTGIALRVATTVTVGAENLDGVASLVRTLAEQSDVYRIISLQPVAQVGRTRDGLNAVNLDSVWDEIARGLTGVPNGASLLADRLTFGHPDCSRVVLGLVNRSGPDLRYHTLRPASDPVQRADVDAVYDRWGGWTLRADSTLVRFARLSGMFVQSPGLWLRRLLPYAWRWMGRLSGSRAGQLGGTRARLGQVLALLRRRSTLHGMAIVTHHFMDRQMLATERGQERASACTFRVPHQGRLVSMCEFNASQGRAELYAALRRTTETGKPLTAPPQQPAPN